MQDQNELLQLIARALIINGQVAAMQAANQAAMNQGKAPYAFSAFRDRVTELSQIEQHITTE